MQTKASLTQYLHSKSLSSELVQLLINAGDKPSDSLIDKIAGRGSEVIPQLIAIMTDDQLADTSAPGEGRVPIHATRILKRMKAVEATEPMLKLLARCETMEVIYSELVFALKAIGAPALEPVLEAHSKSKSEDLRGALAEVLSGLGVHDPRIFEILLKVFRRNPDFGAGNFAEYGAPAALPYLNEALDSCKLYALDGTLREHVRFTIIQLADAIEEVGGRLTPKQERLLQKAKSTKRTECPRRPEMLDWIPRGATVPVSQQRF